MRSFFLLLIVTFMLTACRNPLEPYTVCPVVDHQTTILDPDGNPITVNMWKYPDDPYFYAHALNETAPGCRTQYR